MPLTDDIPTIISIFAIGLAGLSLYISYKNRPFRIKIYESHTEALKRIVEEWKNSLPMINSAESLDDIKPIHLDIEDNVFFIDLMENHIPGDLEISKHWQDLKGRIDSINAKKVLIHEGLIKKIQNATGAGLCSKWQPFVSADQNEDGFGYELMSVIIRNISGGINQNPKVWEWAISWEQKIFRFNGIPIIRSSLDPLKVKETIVTLLSDRYLMEDIQNYEMERLEINKAEEDLRRELTTLFDYPILSGTCRYLKKIP